jgi:hypothetical protein
MKGKGEGSESGFVSSPARDQEKEVRGDAPASTMSCIDALGSISIALRFVNPLTLVASFPNF